MQGSILPINGALMSKILFVLNHPNQFSYQIETSSDPNINIKNGYEQNVKLVKYDKRGEANKFSLYMLYAAILAMVSSFFKRYFLDWLVSELLTG